MAVGDDHVFSRDRGDASGFQLAGHAAFGGSGVSWLVRDLSGLGAWVLLGTTTKE